MTAPLACDDACTQRSLCTRCLASVLQPSLESRGLRCGWNGGHCVLGNASGPVFPSQGQTWRWTDSALVTQPRFVARACAEYRPCPAAASRCAECVAAYASPAPAEDCVFCLDARVPVGVEGEGGGRCATSCVGAATVAWSNASLCPAMPDDAPSLSSTVPPAPFDRSRPQSVLLYGSLCLVLVLLVFLVNKLSE
jgi:hypothetical protein